MKFIDENSLNRLNFKELFKGFGKTPLFLLNIPL